MQDLRLDFVEGPMETLSTSDALLPQLSSLSEEKIEQLKRSCRDCDAVCTPPGYDVCTCKDQMPA